MRPVAGSSPAPPLTAETRIIDLRPFDRSAPDDVGCAWCDGGDAEFDWYPAVLAEIADDLTGPARHAVACRGTGDRPLLEGVRRSLAALRPSGRTVVDVGAGTCGAADWLRAQGFEVTAVEPSEASLRTARTLFGDVPAVRGDATALPLPDAGRRSGQDAALLLGVVSLLDDVVAVLQEARRVVRRGGLLVLTDYVALDHGARSRARLPGGTRAHLLTDLLGAVRGSGWTLRGTSVGAIEPDPAWAAARRRADALVARHVARLRHGERAACPQAFAAERRARTRFGSAIASGAVTRVTLLAQAGRSMAR